MLRPSFARTLVSALVLAVACPYPSLRTLHAQAAPLADGPNGTQPYENYDVRDLAAPTDPAAAAAARAKYQQRQAAAPAKVEAVATLTRNMAAARTALKASVPMLQIENGRSAVVPEIVGTTGADQFLTADSALPRVETVRGFLADNAALYGLTAEQAAGLVVFSDYANPSGNLSWVGLKQMVNGLPVFQGEILAAITSRGALARTTSNLAPGLDEASLPATASLTPLQAAVRAGAAIGRTLDARRLTLTSTEADGRISFVGGGPFSRETRTELLYFPLEPGVATLAYAMVLWDQPAAYYILVDANDGTLLFRKCITQDQSQTVTYNVYTGDSPAPLSPTTTLPGTGAQAPGVARQDVTLVADSLTASPLGWIADSATGASVTTTGNNCDAGLDLVAPNGIDTGSRPTTTNRVFSFSYNPPPLGTDSPAGSAYASGAVVNLFFWTNRYHDRLYQLGFTEQARNFQTTNTFTIGGDPTNRGGNGGDPVLAEVHDYLGTNNANFSTPSDGQAGRMQMYIFNPTTPNRDGSLDGDVFLHELTHGLSNRLHSNGSGLTGIQARGMGEGWSDFYARCLLSTADENVDGIYASGGYVTYAYGGSTSNYYYGIRRFPYAVISHVGANGRPHNPETFADVDTTQINLLDGAYPPNPIFGTGSATEVHNIGEVWCAMLLEVRARFIKRLGYAVGNERALQVVTDAMKLDPTNPTMVQARDAIIAADNSGFAGADVLDIRAGFAARGMGAGATTTGTVVVEAFAPELALSSVAVSDSPGNGNGVPDPGEDLLLSVPLTNVGSVGEVATATVGNYTATYDLPPNGGSATRVIPYRVPAATTPGTILSVPVTYKGLYGTYTYTVRLTVGSPVYGFFQNFDMGVTAPALPGDWTTTTAAATNGVAGNAWTTVGSPTVDSGNSAYTPDRPGSGSAGGEASLVSPVIALPGSGALRLAFKQTYTIQGDYDGGVLEIKVGTGAFTDIVSAGGMFVTGGYSGRITTASLGNPLQGRSAWSGADTAKAVLINLPASVLGQSVQFRWRLGFDYAVRDTGWYVDSVGVITGYTATSIDTDGDGLQNGYETANGLDPNDAADASLDSDGDGTSNLQEYLAGTDPKKATSVLGITSTTYSPAGGLTLSFPTVVGKVYQLDYKNDLTTSTWTSVPGTYNGTGSNLIVTFSATDLGGQSARFYRARVVTP